jgi:hypothetical protein
VSSSEAREEIALLLAANHYPKYQRFGTQKRKPISSLYKYNFAKISLVRALGIAERGQGIVQRKMDMAEESPLEMAPLSVPGVGNDSPKDPSPLTDTKDAPRSNRSPKRRRNIVVLIVIVVVLVGVFLSRHFGSYESTDDAHADVHLYPVSTRVSGYVVRVNVSGCSLVLSKADRSRGAYGLRGCKSSLRARRLRIRGIDLCFLSRVDHYFLFGNRVQHRHTGADMLLYEFARSMREPLGQ